jgi:type IV pilus assembly protein PilA
MGYAQTLQQSQRYFMKWAAAIAAIFLVSSPCFAQAKPAAQQAQTPWDKDLNKYPGLLDEFGRLVEKLQQNIQYPAARGESHLLPLLPASTMSYAAFPNYGDVTHQALAIFRQELQESAVLRDWWAHGELAAGGPKLEDSLEKLEQFQQYIGGEIVVSGTMEGKEPNLLVVAEVRKPGLKKFLQELLSQAAGNSKPDIRVLDLQELATTKDEGPSQILNLLVRPDFVVAASDLATLRKFSARLDRPSREFASTPFGQRVVKEYEGGVTILAAANLQKILTQVPPDAKQNANFQRSGFADVKYLVWEHKDVADHTLSQTELSFNGPRRGAASWLAKSGPLTNLDFVSPKAMAAFTLVIANPPQVFEDLKELYSASSSNPFATLSAFEQVLKLSLKDDLLSYLGGEITMELDGVTPPAPVWKAMLKVNDAGRLQQTLSSLLAAGHLEAQRFDEGGVTYYTVPIPSGNTTLDIDYAFVDGHLIVGSSHEVVADAVRLHVSGRSLAKSQKFLASLPPGHSLEASALLYQDPAALTALSMRQVAPELAESLARFTKETSPAVVCLYGQETAIREASRGGAFDVGAALVVAAIAIPNLARSRVAANEATAVGSLRTVNTAEVMYAATYPQRGFASDLAKFGTAPRGPDAESADQAGFLDESLANASCTGDAWCTKSGYHFRVKAICKQQLCEDYVVVAKPVDSNTGTRSFCSTSDGIIRNKSGSPLISPVSVSECKTWLPIQ